MLPSLRGLQALSALSRFGTLTAAAEALGVTRSALSHRIAELQTQLGVTLAQKAGRHLRLTDEAESLLATMGDALERIESAVAPLRRRNQLRISTVNTFASLWLLPRLPSFAARHPDIEIALSSTRRVVDLAVEEVDCAIRHGRGSWPGLVSMLIFRETLVPVAAPTVKPDFRTATLIRARSRFRDWTLWRRVSGVATSTRSTALIVESGAQALEAAVAGAGIAMMNVSYIGAAVAQGRLRVLGPPVELAEGYYLVHRPAGRSNRQLQAFRDWLRGEIESNARELTRRQ